MISEEIIYQLAKRAQLEIKTEELPVYLKTLSELEKELVNFRKIKLPKKTQPLTRINTGCLTQKSLEKLAKKFPQPTSLASRHPSYIRFTKQVNVNN